MSAERAMSYGYRRTIAILEERRLDEKAIVVVNLPGAEEAYTIKLQETARDSLTGETGRSFDVSPGDGRILTAE